VLNRTACFRRFSPGLTYITDQLRAFSAETDGVSFVDASAPFVNGDGSRILVDMMPDALHPSAAGERAMDALRGAYVASFLAQSSPARRLSSASSIVVRSRASAAAGLQVLPSADQSPSCTATHSHRQAAFRMCSHSARGRDRIAGGRHSMVSSAIQRKNLPADHQVRTGVRSRACCHTWQGCTACDDYL
jgi:hypothetical protein